MRYCIVQKKEDFDGEGVDVCPGGGNRGKCRRTLLAHTKRKKREYEIRGRKKGNMPTQEEISTEKTVSKRRQKLSKDKELHLLWVIGISKSRAGKGNGGEERNGCWKKINGSTRYHNGPKDQFQGES